MLVLDTFQFIRMLAVWSVNSSFSLVRRVNCRAAMMTSSRFCVLFHSGCCAVGFVPKSASTGPCPAAMHAADIYRRRTVRCGVPQSRWSIQSWWSYEDSGWALIGFSFVNRRSHCDVDWVCDILSTRCAAPIEIRAAVDDAAQQQSILSSANKLWRETEVVNYSLDSYKLSPVS